MQLHKLIQVGCISRFLEGSIITSLCTLLLTFVIGCKKMVAISEPINTITSAEAFSTDATATSEIVGIYNKMTANATYANFFISCLTGVYSDELKTFGAPSAFDLSNLQANDGNSGAFWTLPYFNIYQANLALEGLTASKMLSTNTKNQLIGEAKFVRAFCYFYLVNLFEDVPLLTTTSWSTNSVKHRTSKSDIFQQVIADLKDAQSLLLNDYSIFGGQRIRPNKWAATALLARAYLYVNDNSNSELQSTSVINNSALYNLTSLDSAFLANNSEAIWQLQPSSIINPYTTQEGNRFVPRLSTVSPSYFITSQLLNAFESGDKRRTKWVNSTTFSGTTYYYPYKYKTRLGTLNVTPSEYTIVLRLSEQYLIRAEARVKQNNLNGAIADINVIRSRAGLLPLPNTLTQAQVVTAIAQENRIEFFAEWGHRFLDLKRSGQADAIIGLLKGNNWQTTDQLFPIPLRELQTNPNLTQNPGYF